MPIKLCLSRFGHRSEEDRRWWVVVATADGTILLTKEENRVDQAPKRKTKGKILKIFPFENFENFVFLV